MRAGGHRGVSRGGVASTFGYSERGRRGMGSYRAGSLRSKVFLYGTVNASAFLQSRPIKLQVATYPSSGYAKELQA